MYACTCHTIVIGHDQEANRESAARSRDKRLKLIADLEYEVQELKRQHEAFKVRAIHPLCPRSGCDAAQATDAALRLRFGARHRFWTPVQKAAHRS